MYIYKTVFSDLWVCRPLCTVISVAWWCRYWWPCNMVAHCRNIQRPKKKTVAYCLPTPIADVTLYLELGKDFCRWQQKQRWPTGQTICSTFWVCCRHCWLTGQACYWTLSCDQLRICSVDWSKLVTWRSPLLNDEGVTHSENNTEVMEMKHGSILTVHHFRVVMLNQW